MKSARFIVWLIIPAGFLFAEKTINLQKVVTMTGTPPLEYFGSNIANLGDVNNDGYEDLGICTNCYPDSNGDIPYIQKIEIYFGGNPFDTFSDITFWEPWYIYRKVKTYGNMDLNGDGYVDIVLADPGYAFERGKVKVYLGSADGPDSISDLVIVGEGERFQLGNDIAFGDINSDGYDDLVISSPNDFYAAYGRVYVYFGGNTLDKVPDWYYQSTDEFAFYGTSVECGDMNNDGYDDFIVGSLGDTSQIYFYAGSDLPSTIPYYKYSATSPSYIGKKSIFVSNWNESEYGMLLSGWIKTGNFNRAVLSILGSSNPDDFQVDTIYSPISQEDQYFFSGFAQGYINNDEYKDIIIETDYYRDTSSILVYLGNSDFSQPDTILSFKEDYSSIRLIGTIDLNADGIDEVLIRREESGENGYISCIDIYSHRPFPVITGNIDNPCTIPEEIVLKPNYPNPFNATTHIPIVVTHSANIKITVLNLLGQEIAILSDRIYKRGEYALEWSPDNLSSGIYLVKMSVENSQKIQTRKMLLMK